MTNKYVLAISGGLNGRDPTQVPLLHQFPAALSLGCGWLRDALLWALPPRD